MIKASLRTNEWKKIIETTCMNCSATFLSSNRVLMYSTKINNYRILKQIHVAIRISNTFFHFDKKNKEKLFNDLNISSLL